VTGGLFFLCLSQLNLCTHPYKELKSLKCQGKTLLDYQNILKNEGQWDKMGLFWGWIPVGGHKERVNEGE
jgi:hypothetical protein